MRNWLKHAFAIDHNTDATPTASQISIIDRVCREVVRRGLTLPSQMMLESTAPMNFLAGQLLRFLQPVLATLLKEDEIRDFADFVERRGAVEYICRRLDQIHSEMKP